MKKIFIILLLVLVAGAVFFFMNFSTAAKKAIETAGSQALGVPVHVAGVNVSLSDRTAGLSGLSVANPQGYKSENILQANNISVQLGEVTQQVVTVKSVVIDGMQVAYELGQGGSNFDVIKGNLRKGGGGSASSGKSGNAEGGSSSASAPEVIIEQLRITNAKLIPAIGGQQAPIDLPEIVINNIGSKQNPATTVQVANQIMAKIMQTSSTTLIQSGVDDGLKKIKEGLKGLF